MNEPRPNAERYCSAALSSGWIGRGNLEEADLKKNVGRRWRNRVVEKTGGSCLIIMIMMMIIIII